jgi:hypothetical protein
MAKLELPDYDPTIEAMHKAIIAEKKNRAEYKNPDGTRNIGASMAGHECNRYIWYHHNGYEKTETYHYKGAYAIDDGYYVEDKLAERLRKVNGIKLITHNEDGKQLGFKDYDGKFKGYIDGIISGLLQAPKIEHIWECKAVKQEKFDNFKEIKKIYGEKNTLRHWNFIYYTQAHIYMHKFKLTRHYTTVASPGARDITSCRTEYNREFAEAIDMKIKRIIKSKRPMARASNSPKAPCCVFCPFKNICHTNENS